jgi:8-oxo-dGTP pyrophosphatase MutT (NUDIX family)
MPLAFDQLIGALSRRLGKPLPGQKAHEPLRAVPIGQTIPRFEHKTPPKLGSVLILLYPDEGLIKFPLTQRPEYAGAHSGQVSLPGGKAEAGESAEQTALREGQEEVGINPSEVEIIGRLSEFFVIPSNFIVTPVVGFQRVRPAFIPDPVEVVKILEGRIDLLVREDAVLTKDIIAARIYPLRAPHFLIEDEIVWGATAMMLNELRMVIREFY